MARRTPLLTPPRSTPSGIEAPAIVGTFGVAATFLAIGVLCSLVVAYGFYNPAFRAMDRVGEA